MYPNYQVEAGLKEQFITIQQELKFFIPRTSCKLLYFIFTI